MSGMTEGQLASMAQQAQTAMVGRISKVVADRGYFKGEEILARQSAGMTPFVPKPLTSGSKAEGRFGKQNFLYMAEDNTYRCLAGRGDLRPSRTASRGRVRITLTVE